MARSGKNKTGTRTQGTNEHGGTRKERKTTVVRNHKSRNIVEKEFYKQFCTHGEDQLKGITMEYPVNGNAAEGELHFYLDGMDKPNLFKEQLTNMLDKLKNKELIESFTILQTFPRWDKKERQPMLIMKCK